jgi:hypothetical protein
MPNLEWQAASMGRRRVLGAGAAAAGVAALAALRGGGVVDAQAATVFDGTVLDQGGAVFNVKSQLFGARGDYSTDDTRAIQSAINAAAAQGGGIVFYPPGNYLVSNLNFGGSNVIHQGVGRSVAVLYQRSGSSGALMSAPFQQAYGWESVVFQDLGFSAYSNQGSNTGGLDLTGVRNSDVRHCRFSFFKAWCVLLQGGPFLGTSDCMYNLFDCCQFENIQAGGAFIRIQGNAASVPSGPLTIRDCHFNTQIGTQATGITGLANTLRCIGNAFMETPTPIAIAGSQNLFLGNYMEATQGTMTVSVDPGNAVYSTFGNLFQANTYATYGNPSAFTFVDHGVRTMRLADGYPPVTSGILS